MQSTAKYTVDKVRLAQVLVCSIFFSIIGGMVLAAGLMVKWVLG